MRKMGTTKKLLNKYTLFLHFFFFFSTSSSSSLPASKRRILVAVFRVQLLSPPLPSQTWILGPGLRTLPIEAAHTRREHTTPTDSEVSVDGDDSDDDDDNDDDDDVCVMVVVTASSSNRKKINIKEARQAQK
jgi:hypothetical protein